MSCASPDRRQWAGKFFPLLKAWSSLIKTAILLIVSVPIWSYAPKGESLAASRRSWGRSKYKGVTKGKAGHWKAQISAGDGVGVIGLGTFETQEEAARAYDAAALKQYKGFARLNFPVESQEVAA